MNNKIKIFSTFLMILSMCSCSPVQEQISSETIVEEEKNIVCLGFTDNYFASKNYSVLITEDNYESLDYPKSYIGQYVIDEIPLGAYSYLLTPSAMA